MESNGLEKSFNLIVLAARTQLEKSTKNQLTSLIASTSIDWTLVFRQTAYHRVLPLLYQTLQDTCPEALPDPVLRQLKQESYRVAAHNLSLLREQNNILRLFEAKDIPVLSFKGLILAHSAYSNIGLRSCGDLDLLVPERRYEEVEQLLNDIGYHRPPRKETAGSLRRRFDLFLSQQDSFVREGRYWVDVHLSIMPPGYYYPIDFRALWQRSRRVDVSGVPMYGFSPEDALQVLCYHGIKNRWERLKHYCDVAETVRSHRTEMDWDQVLARARMVRGEGILLLGLHMADMLFDVPIPSEVQLRIRGNDKVGQLSRWLLNRLPHQVELGMMEAGERFTLHTEVQDTWATKLRYITYSALRRL